MNLENALVSQLLNLISQQKNENANDSVIRSHHQPVVNPTPTTGGLMPQINYPHVTQQLNLNNNSTMTNNNGSLKMTNPQQYLMQQLMLQQLTNNSCSSTSSVTNNSDLHQALWGKTLMSQMTQRHPSLPTAPTITPTASNNDFNLLLSLMASQKQLTEASVNSLAPSQLEQQAVAMLNLQQQLQLMQQNQLMQQILMNQNSFVNPTGSTNDSAFLAGLMGLTNNFYAKPSSPASSCSSNQCSSEKSNSMPAKSKREASKAENSTQRSDSPLLNERDKRKRKNSTETANLDKSLQEDSKKLRSTQNPNDLLYQTPLTLGWKRETIVKGVGPAGIFGDVSYVTPCGKRLWKIETVFEHLNNLDNDQLTVKAFNFRSTYRLGTYFEYNADTNQTLTEIPSEKIDRLLDSEFGNQTKSNSTNPLATNPSTDPSKSAKLKEEEILKDLINPEKTPQIMEELTKFFHNLIDEQKKFEDNYAKDKETFIKAERERLFQSYVEQGISSELKKQVDDLKLLNIPDLPNFEDIKGLKMSPDIFANCLVILEFLHAFNDCFAIEKDSIPSMTTLQAAFVDCDRSAIDAVIHLVIELLRLAVLDPGISNTKLYTITTGKKFTELEINLETYSGVLRAFIIGRNGYEDEMSDWLDESPPINDPPQDDETKKSADSDHSDDNSQDEDDANDKEDEDIPVITLPTKNFQNLSGEQQCSLLCFLVDELVCNSKIVQIEVDKTMEHHLTLKRDKWAIDNKIRRLKIILNRKCLGPNLMAMNESFDNSRLNNGEKDKVLEEFGWDVNKPTLTQNTVQLSEMEVEMPPSDDEESIDLGVLETRIRKLQTMAEVKQKLIDECVFKLWGCFLGQDRFKRNYHLFGSFGGLFIEGPSYHDEKDSGFNSEMIAEEILRRRELSEKRNMKNLFGPHLSKRFIPPSTPEKMDQDTKESSIEKIVNDESFSTEIKEIKIEANALDLSLEKNEQIVKSETDENLKKTPSSLIRKDETFANVAKEKVVPNELTPEKQRDLCEKFGLDDTILTTAALLYITQNNIAETSGSSMWQTLALEYKKILTKLVSDELQVFNNKDEMDQGSLSKCLLHLSDWLKKNKNQNSSKFDVDHESLKADLPMKEIDEKIYNSLVKLNIQSDKMKPVEKEHMNCWKLANQSGEHLITEYMRVSAQRGFREKNLSKCIRKNEELIISNMRMKLLEIPEDEDSEHSWIKIRSRRMKGRAELKKLARKLDQKSNGKEIGEAKETCVKKNRGNRDLNLAKRLAIITGNEAHLSDPDYVDECNLIEDIENLEDRVLSSSLQKKGWQASVRIIDDDTIFLISSKCERKSKLDQFPLDVAKTKLLQLQENIETRYLISQSLASCKEVDMNDWIGKVNSATKASQVRSLVKDFIATLAWHKSIMKVLCQICFKDNNEAALLLCDGCDQGFHMYCFRPVLDSIPDGNWFCFDCQCKKSEDDLKLCFICGHRDGGNVEIENFKSTMTSRKLTSCDNCQRCVHPECLRPPQPKLPKKWYCTGCSQAESKVERKRGPPKKKVDNSNQDADIQSQSSSSSQSKKPNGKSKSLPQQNKPKPQKKPKKLKNLTPLETKDANSDNASESENNSNGSTNENLKELRAPLWPENPQEFEYMNDEILEYCRVSTNKMIDHDSSWPFRTPVNAKQIPMYRKIIKKPMDLSYIVKKCYLNSRIAYRKFKNWVDDVRLIFRNCEIFNEDNSDIGKSGHTMCVFFEKEIMNPDVLKPIFDRYEASEDEEDEESDEENLDQDNPDIPNITETDFCQEEMTTNNISEKKKTPSPPNLQKPSPIPPITETSH